MNFIANFLVSQAVKELWKSADIWRSYGKSKKVRVFWDTVYNGEKTTTAVQTVPLYVFACYNREYDYRNSHNDHYADSQHCNDDGYDRNYRYFRVHWSAITGILLLIPLRNSGFLSQRIIPFQLGDEYENRRLSRYQ